MTFSSALGNYGFSTLYETFTNEEGSVRTYRVVKIIKDIKSGTEIDRVTELIAVKNGVTASIHQSANNGTTVTFRVFRRDFDTTGDYTETKVLEETHTTPLAPLGPR
jgi:hypothetical protein